MTPPTNGITADVIRDVMPPYELSADLLAAALASIPPPPPGATQAWRQVRTLRFVREIAGLMPADAPQARIAAQILIVREAADDTFARVNEPGLTVDQVCRLRRTGSALTIATTALERLLTRHQQRPAPFFGTVLPDAIDMPALAAGWGGAGLGPDDAGESGGGEGGLTDGPVPMGETGPGMTRERGPDVVVEAGPDDAVALCRGGGMTDGPAAGGATGPTMTGERGPDVAMEAGRAASAALFGGGGGSTDGLVRAGMAEMGPAMTKEWGRRRPRPSKDTVRRVRGRTPRRAPG
jgi:hypothetical protein